MIEQFCESILKQLSTLQKQRECPQEAMEPMSTLIFAAARFSDLPELCDLRRIFTERYGSHMESSVKAEFVEKIQKKSFSQEKKLQLMKDIAQEFSVTWDSSAFERKLSNVYAPKYDQPKNGMHRHSASQKPSTRLPNGDEEEISSKGKYEHAHVSVWKQEVRKEPKDIHAVTKFKDGFSHDLMERTRKVIADEPENVEPDFSNAAVPSYAKPRRSQNRTYNHDQLKDGVAHKRTGKGQEALDTIVSDEQAFDMKKSSRGGKAAKMAPPYTKSHDEKNSNGLIYDRLQEVEEDYTSLERQPVRPVNNGRLINMRPPYVKLKVNDPSHPDQAIRDSKITGHDRYDVSEDLEGGVFVDEKLKPVSVRRRVAKPRAIDTIDSTIDEEKIMIQTPGGRGSDTGRRGTATRDEVTGDVNKKKIMERRPGPPVDDEMDSAIDYGKLLRRTPSGQRRHGSRKSATAYDGGGDEEEMIMDKLLIHYSRKGTASEASKIRIRSKALPVDHVEHEIKDKIRPGLRESVHVPDRSSSLPPELTKPEAGVKMHSRAASMQPDMLSPNGAHVHPRLPNYNELAAQFNALRRS
ncbi:uncharacterized protein LOC103713776 isoform X2 [Phoenix dactylifera]|nr:uncharacterized protein LOC103713776 isoform X2 [Phoenix dactylifera]